MKLNKKNMHRALVHTFFELYTVRQLAEEVVDVLDEKDIGSTELHSAKQGGFTIRCKKDLELEDDTVTEAIADAMQSMLEKKEDEAQDLMLDNCDLILNLEYINSDLVRSIFDISRNGRLIIVEVDL